MLTGSMLAVWALQRREAIDATGTWLPDGVTIPEVPTNVMLIAFIGICVFGQWAVWSAKRNDRPHTVLALGCTALVALLVINAQAFVYDRMGLGVGDGTYAAMFYAITGMFMAADDHRPGVHHRRRLPIHRRSLRRPGDPRFPRHLLVRDVGDLRRHLVPRLRHQVSD